MDKHSTDDVRWHVVTGSSSSNEHVSSAGPTISHAEAVGRPEHMCSYLNGSDRADGALDGSFEVVHERVTGL